MQQKVREAGASYVANALLPIAKEAGFEFTEEDFNSSIISLCDAFKGVEDSPVGICNFYSSQDFDDEIVSGPEFAEKISQVTREQVIEAAKKVSIDSVYLLKGEGAENE